MKKLFIRSSFILVSLVSVCAAKESLTTKPVCKLDLSRVIEEFNAYQSSLLDLHKPQMPEMIDFLAIRILDRYQFRKDNPSTLKVDDLIARLMLFGRN
ncbi:MAG: hypothetical protein NTU89_00130 [Candidatus Dependentiae bacterium]|nr:hypothetical protein [Candidatus Dependentiae bacterium]